MNTTYPASTQENLEEPREPNRMNLYESGLRRSSRQTELNAKQSLANKQKVHVSYGTRLSRKILGLLTIISMLVSEISLPKVQVSSNASLTDRIV